MKPWVHLFVSQYGTVGPCCLAPWGKEETFGDINEQSIEEIWNGEKMRAFRLKMLMDEPDSRCQACYACEANGLSSPRIGTNFYYSDQLQRAFATQPDGSVQNANPIYWDIRISNLCNLKCRICGHDSSSEWYRDAQEMGLFTYAEKVHRGPKDFNKLFSQLKLLATEVEEIYFAGGEPSVTEEVYLLLQHLIDIGRTNLRIYYVTNFSRSTYKHYDLYEMFSRFEDVNVLASLDDMGAQVEIQRHGLKWDQAVTNRKRMLKVAPEVNLCVTPTASVFNVLHLPAFHKQWVMDGLIDIDGFMPHILSNPPQYSITMLPASLKQEVQKLYERHMQWIIDFAALNPPKPYRFPAGKFERIQHTVHWVKKKGITGHDRLDMHIAQFQGILAYMNSADSSNLSPEFVKTTARLDELRNENTRMAFPELEELWLLSERP